MPVNLSMGFCSVCGRGVVPHYNRYSSLTSKSVDYKKLFKDEQHQAANSMELSEDHYQILDTLYREEISTQRQLAEQAGISLGQVNYVLKSFLEKGLVKIGNFRKNPRKTGYVYILTPKGIEAKSRLASKFVIRKLKEYHCVRERLAERLAAIEDKGRRIVFVGPAVVKDLMNSIIRENALDLTLVGHCSCRESLRNYWPDSFDVALLFDSSKKDTRKISKEAGIPSRKLLALW
jgi:EPS-associated MarR family transcriptional regulator